MNFETNQLIDDRYCIIAKLDEGGMGAVWKATDSRTNDSVVVLKFPLKYRDPEILERFAREATTMRELAGDCDNILDIQDIGSVPVSDIDDVPYYVMRLQTGGALRDWKPATDQNGTPIFTRESLDWVTGVARALDFLHHQKVPVYHRDVKPENILFNATGTPKLADFGIVKNIKKATTTITKTGAAMGTVAYMPPEIWRGGDFSPASDQFSFAASVYEMLSGKRPYDGETPFAMLEALSKGHDKLAQFIGLPARASAVLDQALEHEPEKRFDSCSKFAEAFLAGLSGNPLLIENPAELPTGIHLQDHDRKAIKQIVVGGQRVEMLEPSQRGSKVKRSKSAAIVGSIVVLAGLVGGGFFLSGAFSPVDNPAPVVTGPLAITNPPATQEDQPNTKDPAVPNLQSPPALASYELAQNLFTGAGGEPKDQPRAVSMFEELAENGSLKSQKRLVKLFSDGELGTVDFEKSFKWLLTAAEQGDAESQMAVGSGYSTEQRGAPRDLEAAVNWLKKSADQNHGPAQLMLGVHYSDGLGVEEDLEEAKRWLERAVASGELEAKPLLSKLKARTAKELTVAEYRQSSTSLVQEHAGFGFPTAQVIIGLRYRDGNGIRESQSNALKWFREAANQNDKTAQYHLGRCYAEGIEVVKNDKEAISWLRKSAEQNYGPAQMELGRHYSRGFGVDEDLGEAKRWLELAHSSGVSEASDVLDDLEKRMIKELSFEAYKELPLALVRVHANRDFAEAQYRLGVKYDNGEGLAEDDREAVKWFRKAAEQGNAKAQHQLGLKYSDGDAVAEDDIEAVKWFRKAAMQGYDRAQYSLAFRHTKGKGVVKDDWAAVKWYRKAAQQGNANAQYDLGAMYAHGRSGGMNVDEAIMWLRSAAEQGRRDAYTNLGYIYEEGLGVSKDSAKAFRMYKVASERGSKFSQNNIGNMYIDGRGVPVNYREAVKWFRKSAAQGYALGQFNLGLRYANGEGVSKDDSEAVRWYRKSAAQGNPKALKELQNRGLN